MSLGVIKAAGVRRVSGSGMASAGYYPPGHRKRAVVLVISSLYHDGSYCIIKLSKRSRGASYDL